MPYTAYTALRTVLLAAIDAAWPEIQGKLTDSPVQPPSTPYSVTSCVITSDFGPGSNSVTRFYTWDTAYVFKPGPADNQPIDLVKIAKAEALVDLIQLVNIGGYGYLPIAPLVIMQTPPDLLEKGLASVIIRWQVRVDEDHHV